MSIINITTPAVSTFWQNHKKTIIAIVIVLIAFLTGFGSAKFASPAKVVTKTEIQTVTKTNTVYKDRIVTQKVYIEVEKKKQHTETTTTKQPDGTVVTKIVQDVNTDVSEHSDTTKDADHQNNTTTATQQKVTETKTVTNQSDWSVYAGVGLSVPHFISHQDMGVPGLQGLVVQAGIDRRIVGPFSVGLFANTLGTLGLNLRGSF